MKGDQTPLSKETIENRRAAMDMARKQAIAGDPVCGALFALESMADLDASASFLAKTAMDWRDEDDDDEMRPY